jgi:hypothetical protein
VPISSARWRPLLAPPKFSISIATNKSNNKTQNQNKTPRPFSLPNTSDDGRKKKQQRKLREVVVVLSTVSVVPPDNNSVGRLSTFNSDYAHTHTHTRTGSARDMHLLRDVEAKDSQRETHTHAHTAPVKKTRNNSPVSNNLLAVSL